MRFKLLHGVHQQRSKDGKTSETFRASDPNRNIVESHIDLEAKCGSEKFQNLDRLGVGEDGPALRRRIEQLEAENERMRQQMAAEDEAAEDGVDLSSMTVEQLYSFAEEQDLGEISKGLKKAELVDFIESLLDSA